MVPAEWELKPLEAEAGEEDFSPEGFGASATGGEGQTVYHVTNLNDSGTGSLRSLLAGGLSNRYIVFDVGGTITLSGDIEVTGSYITIDGTSSPSPGITLAGDALGINNTNHIIVKGIRHRGEEIGVDAFYVYNSHDILFSQCSASHSVDGTDGCLDITAGSHDITVQWCIFHMRTDGSDGGNMAVAYDIYNITIHHCILSGNSRLPLVKWKEDTTETSSTSVDAVNNIVWQWGFEVGEIDGDPHYAPGMGVDGGSHANSKYCFFQSDVSYPGIEDYGIVIDPYFGTNAKCYANGNYSGNAVDIDAIGNVGSPYSAPSVTTQSVSSAISLCLENAGARGTSFGLDTTDQAVVDDITNNANLP